MITLFEYIKNRCSPNKFYFVGDQVDVPIFNLSSYNVIAIKNGTYTLANDIIIMENVPLDYIVASK